MESIDSPADKPPRQRRTLEQARDLVSAWNASGLGKEPFCRAQGILRSTLLSSLERVTGSRSPSRSAASFIEVRPAVGAAPALTVEIEPGLRVTGLDIATVVALVQALRGGQP